MYDLLCADGNDDLGDYETVDTSLGAIRGMRERSSEENEGGVVEYLGIPYALPPTGSQRFVDPQPIRNLPSGE